MGKRCTSCMKENDDSAVVCERCGANIAGTAGSGTGNAAFVWKIRCPVCRHEYDVEDENSIIEICSLHKDDVDKRKIAKKRPYKVCLPGAPVNEAIPEAIAADTAAVPQLVFVMTDVNTGKAITIRDSCILGREGSIASEYFAQDMEISRKHCSIDLDEGNYIVRHLSQTNPTKINNIGLPHGIGKMIRNGDTLTIARKEFKISLCPDSAAHSEGLSDAR